MICSGEGRAGGGEGEPNIVFQATKAIEVGDEILFDYNDKESRLGFLRKCSVCNAGNDTQPATTSRKRPAADTDIEPDSDDEAAGETNPAVSSAATAAESTAGGEQSTSGSATRQLKKKREEESVAPEPFSVNPADLTRPAGQKHLMKEDRETLYAGVQRTFPIAKGPIIMRTMLEQWQPTICDENIQYILMRRITEAANAMLSNMNNAAQQRQLKIWESLQSNK
jgi:hypothetical protein